ncbi:MAG: hypothetical protein ACI9FB_000737 [Candidatus Azotimanducaceae bacterium]|jgi:hypothetical protein
MKLHLHAQKGVILIAILSVLVVLFTTLMVSTLSFDKLRANKIQSTTRILNTALENLQGYALVQIPPGSLPCPDSTGDGFENTAVGGCQSQRGLLPYRTLNMEAQNDQSGAALWYAVDRAFVVNSVGDRNASRVTTLSLDGRLMSAVIIAPGNAINGQGRTNLIAADFLEGLNADASLDSYARPQSDIENDQLLGLPVGLYWSLMIKPVNEAISQLLADYKAACSEFPFAAGFGGPYTSINNLQAGSLPLTTALPVDWGDVCPFGIAPTPPAWLVNHWQDELYYQMCTVAEGSCIQLVGDSNLSGSAVIIGPGITLSGQSRPSVIRSNYFELENIALPDTQFRDLDTINHSATYNDITRIVIP